MSDKAKPLKSFAAQLSQLLSVAERHLAAAERFDDDLSALDHQVRDRIEQALVHHEARMHGLVTAMQMRYERLSPKAVPPIEERTADTNPRFIENHRRQISQAAENARILREALARNKEPEARNNPPPIPHQKREHEGAGW